MISIKICKFVQFDKCKSYTMPVDVLDWLFEFNILFFTNVITCFTQIQSQTLKSLSLQSYGRVINVIAVGADNAGAEASATFKTCIYLVQEGDMQQLVHNTDI